MLKQLLNISHDNFNVLYEDDEGDWVSFSSNAELDYAWKLVGPKALRLKIEEKTMNPSVPVVTSPVASPALSRLCELKMELQAVKIESKRIRKEHKWEKKEQKAEKKLAKLRQKGVDVGNAFVARFVQHVTVEDNYEFAPGVAFTKIWRFRNEGTAPWPENTVLLFVAFKRGDQMRAPEFVRLPKIVLPGEEIDVSVPMVAPASPGCYFGHWRLAELNGRKFGQRVRVLIKVVGDSSSSDDSPSQTPTAWGAMLKELESMGFTNKAKNIKLIIKTRGDMDKVIAKLLKKEEKRSGRAKPSC